MVNIKAGDDVPYREALTDPALVNVVHLQAVAHACHQVFLSCPAEYKKTRIIPGTMRTYYSGNLSALGADITCVVTSCQHYPVLPLHNAGQPADVRAPAVR